MTPSTVLRAISLNSLLFLLGIRSGVLAGYAEIPPPAAAVFLIESPSNETTNYNLDTKIEQDGSQNVNSSYPDSNRILINDIVNTDVEVKPGLKVELECMASNPVQWSYRGPGRPEFVTGVSLDVRNNREVYKATLNIPDANEKDTGLYICHYAEFPRIASSYHIFVPGPEVFVAGSGRTITYSSQTPIVTIPCPVSVKRAKVTLRKVNLDKALRQIDPPIAIYDPKFGFKLNTRDLRDADGTYICSGYYDGTLRVREYTLRNEENNHTTTVTFPEGIQDDINPCLSYSCPSRSICRVNLNTNLPFCACRGKSGPSVTNCTRLCKISQDCPKTEKCQFNVERQLKMCVHVCDGHKCAENGECYVEEQRGSPKCRCKRGYQGNGNDRCERIPLKNDDLEENSYCSSAACGPHAKCQNIGGKVQCACHHIGYFGSWPNCEKACTQDTDCDFQERCSPKKGVCEHACNDNMCAPKAECKVLRRKPMCVCPPGYTGRATEACYPSHYFFSSRSGMPSEADTESDLMETVETTIIPGKVKFEDEIVVVEDQENESFKLSLPVEVDEEATQSSASVKFTR